MSIANIVLAPFELHQERHEEEGCIHRLGRALNPAHAAPNGAVLLPSSTENSEQPTSSWNERKAPETGVVPISSGYTLGFWGGREERGQT